MQIKKLVGCVPILFLCFLLSVLAFFVGGNILGRAQEPSFIQTRIDAPAQVSVNEPFEVKVFIRNVAPEEILLHSIDISNPYLEAITIASLAPEPSKEQNIPIVDFTSYEFGQTIPIGGTQVVVFEFIGSENGRFTGEIDICVEASVICKLMEIETVISN